MKILAANFLSFKLNIMNTKRENKVNTFQAKQSLLINKPIYNNQIK